MHLVCLILLVNCLGMKLTVMLIVLSWSHSYDAFSVLVFLPNPLRSHYDQVEPIFYALALRGHNVTVVSPYPPKDQTSNLRHIFLSADRFMKHTAADWNMMELSLTDDQFSIDQWKLHADVFVPEVLGSTVFGDLTRGASRFDLVFLELFFGQEALAVLGHIFDAPVVTYASFGHTPDVLRFAGAANAVAYLPYMELRTAGPLSLFQRLRNTWMQYASMLYHEYWYYPQHDALLAKYISKPLPRIRDMLHNISLYLLTGNVAVDGAKLYPPHVIEISELNIKGTNPLDEEIKVIMDQAENGVIFFCFGTLLQASSFRKEAVNTFLSVFKELKQTVLWKSNLNASDWDIPKNVHMRNWFDQPSILAHQNCVLFLTHGGLSSMMEAIRYAVPVAGMPFYGDQWRLLAYAEYLGYGLRLEYKNLTQKSLSWVIKTVLEDPTYKENIRRASKILSDKPMTSLETAVYFLEYVVRHKGAHHLKPLATKIPTYQLFLIDVIAIYGTLFFVVFYLILKLVILSWTRICKTQLKEKAD
ncbi:UDP-glucosyltransferase 2 isoform X2 [Bemisia tabaci]|uniref:UDP-glucosyltransferase 2 isoform X2 n=1 Tax=Bemisia tabaci TaxID=7038 RepID=UPI003B27F874